MVVAIAQSIKRQDQQRDFVPRLSKQAGYPIWNKAKILTNKSGGNATRLESEDSKIAIIPFAKEDKGETNAVLFVNTKETDTTFKLLYASQYDEFGFKVIEDSISALDVFHLFARFDYDIFGHRVFLIKDRQLAMDNDIIDTSDLYAELRMVAIATECDIYDWCWQDYGAPPPCNGNCTTSCPAYAYSTEDCYTIWFDLGGGEEEEEGPNGNGGGNWEDENPCRAAPGNNDPCGSDNDPPGWVPVVDEDEFYTNY